VGPLSSTTKQKSCRKGRVSGEGYAPFVGQIKGVRGLYGACGWGKARLGAEFSETRSAALTPSELPASERLIEDAWQSAYSPRRATESVYRRYAIVSEGDLSDGVAKVAALHGSRRNFARTGTLGDTESDARIRTAESSVASPTGFEAKPAESEQPYMDQPGHVSNDLPGLEDGSS